jgi:hypothetical protein
MTKKEFDEFKFFLKKSNYNLDFINKIIAHLNLIPFQKEINLDIYSLEADTRTKIISAIKHIDWENLLHYKRISYNRNNSKDKFIFSIDSVPKFKNAPF